MVRRRVVEREEPDGCEVPKAAPVVFSILHSATFTLNLSGVKHVQAAPSLSYPAYEASIVLIDSHPPVFFLSGLPYSAPNLLISYSKNDSLFSSSAILDLIPPYRVIEEVPTNTHILMVCVYQCCAFRLSGSPIALALLSTCIIPCAPSDILSVSGT